MLNTNGLSSCASRAGTVPQPILARLMALLLLGALAACGGGGGGGSSGGGTNTGPLVYTGNTNPAVITTANAVELTANVLGSEDASSAISGLSPSAEAEGVTALGRRLNRSVRATPSLSGTAGLTRLTSVAVDRPLPCDSGSARITGDVSNSGTGTLAITWNDCRKGDDTLSGSATMRVEAVDPGTRTILDATITFPRLTLRSVGTSADLSGSTRTQVNLASRMETVTVNFVAQDGAGRMLKADNVVFTDVFDDILNPASFVESVSGRVFDGVHGFVVVVTDAPFVFGTLTQPFPSSGQITLTGANNAHIRATALSTQAVTLGLDLDGNSVFERTATLAWTELGGPAGADLADADGDGMHNSWETAKGLNASDPADAALDRDGDGATNLAEYRAGTDPNSRSSAPPPPPPPAPQVQVIAVAGNTDLVFDAVTQRIYASVRGNPGGNGRIVPINPATGAMESAISVGIDPVKLALSDNGQFLYVGLEGEPAVQRIDLASRSVSLRFLLGDATLGAGQRFVEDMQVLPGNPAAVAISRRNRCCSPRHEGVAIYDNGVPRAATTPEHTGSNVIEFSASSGTLYGYNNESTEFGLRTMRVDAAGVDVTNVFTSFDGPLIGAFGVDIRFAGGRIFTTNGRAINPGVPPTIARTFPLPVAFGNLVVPIGSDRVIFLTFANTVGSLRAFDMNSLPPVELARVDLSGLVGDPGSLIRWGTSGLAFRTSGGQIFLIESTALIPWTE